jgi:hypothetical protein
MPDSHSAPFEDEQPFPPAPQAPSAVLGAPAPASPASEPPAPGSAEEAAIIFEAMSQPSASPSPARPRAGLVVGIIAVLAAAVVALVISVSYLRHQADSGAPAQSTTAPGGPSVTQAALHLRSALATARAFESDHADNLQGLSADLSQAQPSVTFSALSDGAGEVSVTSPVPGTLVLSSLQTSPRACLGVLQVLSSQAAPVFAAYPATAQAGVYYFEAPPLAGDCDGLTLSPPAGAFVSTSDFPTGRLP